MKMIMDMKKKTEDSEGNPDDINMNEMCDKLKNFGENEDTGGQDLEKL